jgi:hypothetical protein
MTIRIGVITSILLLLLAPATIHASQVTGPIQTLRGVNPGNGGPGRTAVMITGAATGCSTPSWYVFENGDTGIGKVWTSLLLTAYSLGKDVTIVGDGVCHTYPDLDPSTTLEGVSRIELN